MSPSSIIRPTALLAALPCITLFAACSSSTGTTGSQTSFPLGSALMTMACDTGDLDIELKTAPTQPLTTGLDGVEVTLTDLQGNPVDGETITLVPWMPLMGHGADLVPTLQAMGKGRYVFTNVNLFMPGEWQLRFEFTGSVACSAAPTFNVP